MLWHYKEASVFNHTNTRYETNLNYLLNSNIVSTQKVINMVVIVTQKLAVYLQITISTRDGQQEMD